MKGVIHAETEVPVQILKIRRFSVEIEINGKREKLREGTTLVVKGEIDWIVK